jgi:hypothetical protein
VSAITPGGGDAYGVSVAANSKENGYLAEGLNAAPAPAPAAGFAPRSAPAPNREEAVVARDADGIPDSPDSPQTLLAQASQLRSAAAGVADVPHSSAMLIYTASLAMAVFQVTQAMDAVERIGRESGGYLAARGDDAVTIRVPRDRFDDAIARVEKLGDVVHRDIKAEDVTDQYVDLQGRLRNAQAARDQLLELLRRANVKEALDIEKELARITEEIESMQGKLKLLRDQIAFSTITVRFAPVVEQDVHDASLLAPFPWLQDLGLQKLLDTNP